MFSSFKPHLIELRKRLAYSTISIVLFTFIAFIFNKELIEIIKYPLVDITGKDPFVGGIGIFFTALKISIFTGFLLSLPVVFWQIWIFIAPGLYQNEKKYIIPFVLISTFMFILGILFAYFIVIPFGFEFLWFFSENLVNFLQTLDEYVSIFTKILFAFGIAFELPIVLFFLGVMGLVTDRNLKDFFGYAIVIIFLISALLTPPDVITQLLMAFPLILLYGVSIIVVKIVNPEKKDEDES